MAHHTLKSSYQKLSYRLNRFPQGATPSELLFKILKMLFSEKEAELVALLPIKPFNVQKASKIWKLNLTATQNILDNLASRAILLDIEQNGEMQYVLPPPMAGFFEFSLMRVRQDIDQKVLSELFYEYMNVEEDFIKSLFTLGETRLGRVFVNESVLSNDNAIHVLDYERASEIINTASHIGVGMCYCRHKMEHIGKACNAPMDICMTFNNVAKSLTRHGHARTIDKNECLDLLNKAYDYNLVQFGENVREDVSFICNCCGCCCEALLAAKRFAILNPIHTSNFIPEIDSKTCNGCSLCAIKCPVNAICIEFDENTNQKLAVIAENLCLGCGICVRVCNRNGIFLKSRSERVLTPLNGTHKAVVMAIERGKFQNLLFDNQVLWNHRAMAAVLGVILKLPPFKQVMASKQVKSRYLENFIKKHNY
ncbi:MAG: (Fe-S)-binding protein [Bacteroidetes bacterium GWF2_33_16]|nr:MAG: (Fe-S)-binding protein [Bacteroidetes bacterium GWE2_32_14]OFY07039.1 MAG: (Fe-S)-binding protein [Bacteroidetes bacterium GWF2_33_16]